MSSTETGKAVAAEERTEEAKSFVRRVKAATRHKHTSDEKDSHRAGGVSEGGDSQRAV